MEILVVVDMQNDFVDGALGTKEAVAIVPKVAEKIRLFMDGADRRVLYTRDTHEEDYLDTQEGRHLPVRHCIRGTKGWEICPEIELLRKEQPIDKPTFGSPVLGQLLKAQDEDLKKQGKEGITSVTLVGLCTDICVISNALLVKAFLPEIPVIVDASCCAGVTVESHQNALQAMNMCQIQIVGQ
ncbi:MAG: cysteine hydrolase [Lachnospiraceae bacterium]|nr:cysteine hydrolase [Lachnospiraceae bacterium]